jgi:hypothetical protein
MLTLCATKATPQMVAVSKSKSEFLTGTDSFFIIFLLVV